MEFKDDNINGFINEKMKSYTTLGVLVIGLVAPNMRNHTPGNSYEILVYVTI
jgi:hypothetical protein